MGTVSVLVSSLEVSAVILLCRDGPLRPGPCSPPAISCGCHPFQVPHPPWVLSLLLHRCCCCLLAGLLSWTLPGLPCPLKHLSALATALPQACRGTCPPKSRLPHGGLPLSSLIPAPLHCPLASGLAVVICCSLSTPFPPGGSHPSFQTAQVSFSQETFSGNLPHHQNSVPLWTCIAPCPPPSTIGVFTKRTSLQLILQGLHGYHFYPASPHPVAPVLYSCSDVFSVSPTGWQAPWRRELCGFHLFVLSTLSGT